MIPVSPTDFPALEFNAGVDDNSRKIKASSSKIGWLHSISDEPGATFDVAIKDALGREVYRKQGCHSDSERFGELVNIETRLGQDLEIFVENLRGAKTLKLFLN